MPVVSVDRQELMTALGKEYTEEEFDELCFDFGIELDDVVEEDDGKTTYKIDLPANRYDLLCLEGLQVALLVFLKQRNTPEFKVVPPADATAAQTKMTVSAATASVRPFVVCAVLRGVTLNDERYKSLMDLQEHLHRNICRRRTLVAIGTHDLDSLQGPFTYEALPPSDISFRHLFAAKEMKGKEMLDWFRTDPAGKHIKEYTDIIYDKEVYPVIYDANRTVLSLPPIINGYHSRVSTSTRNIFIECTATDRTKAEVVLNTVVAMFSAYCDEEFTVEPVVVEYEKEPHADYGLVRTFPNMDKRPVVVSLPGMCSTIGAEVAPERACDLLSRMMLGPAEYLPESNSIKVSVPVTRSDVLHPVDVYEDLAIAYGYNNLETRMPVSHTRGKELPINLLSDLVRFEMSQAGYTEIMSLGLLSLADNFDFLRRERSGNNICIANPKNLGFQVGRTTLLPGLLKTMSENLSLGFAQGIKLFEVSDVLLKDAKSDVGASNYRRVAALYTGPTAGFEIIHGLVDRVMQVLAVAPSMDYAPDAAASAHTLDLIKTEQAVGEYKVVLAGSPDVTGSVMDDGQWKGEDSTFMPGRWACLMVKLKDSPDFVKAGELGILHPEVLSNFRLTYPASLCEIDLQMFL